MYLLAKTCSYDRMNGQRGLARGIVLLGIAILAAMVLGAFTTIDPVSRSPLAYAGTVAIPLVLAIAVFIVGLRYEILAAAILAGGFVLTVLWGVVAGWEAGVWLTMFAVVMAPMLVAAALYLYAAQTQRVCELEETRTRQPRRPTSSGAAAV